MAQDGSARPEAANGDEKARSERLERSKEIRKKYDFSVIRSLRQKRGLTIEKFAKLCGLSYAPISRIETNLIKPNLETLDKIAEGLGVATYNLVALAEKRDAERFDSRDFQAGSFRFKTFTFDSVDVSYGRAPSGAETDRLDVADRDVETVIVQSGRLEVTVDDRVFELGAGECVRYDRVFAHRIRALEDSSVIVLTQSKR